MRDGLANCVTRDLSAEKRRSLLSFRQPGSPAPPAAILSNLDGKGPWLCVADFRQVCLYRRMDFPDRKGDVNSGIYLIWTWSEFRPRETTDVRFGCSSGL